MPAVDPKVFRPYDIRALAPELVDASSVYYRQVGTAAAYQAPLTPAGVELIGRGLGVFFGSGPVVVGRDARLSSPAWAAALADGLMRQGVDVIDIGLSTTDMIYYASGALELPAIEVTASHCTKELNGIKIVRPGADVVGQGSGMEELCELVTSRTLPASPRPGVLSRRDILGEYVDHVLRNVEVGALGRYRIVADAGNGVGGLVARELVRGIPQLTVREMFYEPDGNFPNHAPNPFEAGNAALLVEAVRAERADLGVAWDGDADRVIFIDETGQPVSGDFITALIAGYYLERNPGATIVHDVRASWAVPDTVARYGGRAVTQRVGHSYMKRAMRAFDAVFGGEVSGHYYFRDHFYADNGFMPILRILELLAASGASLSELGSSLGNYFLSGEINSTVEDARAAIERLAVRFADAELDFRDGVSVTYPDWHFNVRSSANDPVIRLNLEARTRAEMEMRRDAVLEIIRA